MPFEFIELLIFVNRMKIIFEYFSFFSSLEILNSQREQQQNTHTSGRFSKNLKKFTKTLTENLKKKKLF